LIDMYKYHNNMESILMEKSYMLKKLAILVGVLFLFLGTVCATCNVIPGIIFLLIILAGDACNGFLTDKTPIDTYSINTDDLNNHVSPVNELYRYQVHINHVNAGFVGHGLSGF